eukprot:COSAG02_NODE_108_length_36286_cov_19.437478_16_plen_55_part_00
MSTSLCGSNRVITSKTSSAVSSVSAGFCELKNPNASLNSRTCTHRVTFCGQALA